VLPNDTGLAAFFEAQEISSLNLPPLTEETGDVGSNVSRRR